MVQQPANSAAGGFLRLQQVLTRIPVSPSSWWAGVKAGKYPAAYKLGPQTTVWHSGDIDALVEKIRNGGAS